MKKQIVCFGDSNTYGHCADPGDSRNGCDRFDESERWPRLLQARLGAGYAVAEDGLRGRTTAFPDPRHENMSGLEAIDGPLTANAPVDLLIIMLGTNDTKERLGIAPSDTADAMERLIRKARSIPCWRGGTPKILLISPPHILPEEACLPGGTPPDKSSVEKSRVLSGYLEAVARKTGCAFLDAQGVAEFNRLDGKHLTARGHQNLADKIAEILTEVI